MLPKSHIKLIFFVYINDDKFIFHFLNCKFKLSGRPDHLPSPTKISSIHFIVITTIFTVQYCIVSVSDRFKSLNDNDCEFFTLRTHYSVTCLFVNSSKERKLRKFIHEVVPFVNCLFLLFSSHIITCLPVTIS